MAPSESGAGRGFDTCHYDTTIADAGGDVVSPPSANVLDPVSPLLASQLDDDEDGEGRGPGYTNRPGDVLDMIAARIRRPVSPIALSRPSSGTSAASTRPHSSNMGSPRPDPRHVRPPPAYVAAVGAIQVANDDRLRSFDSDDDNSDLRFTDPALSLINAFLDHILFGILAHARSTSLPVLRISILHVLQSRLGRATIENANEELRELLSGNDDDEELSDEAEEISDGNSQWNLELVWKRTRLRVMVYTRLGDMEDEDEQRYVRDEDIFHGNDRRFSQTTGLVSWAAAIYLTSVLEFVAEHVIRISAQAAVTRSQVCKRSTTPKSDVVEVGSFDVEKIALHPVLGKIWRIWRRTLRKLPSLGDETEESARNDSPAKRLSSNHEMRTRDESSPTRSKSLRHQHNQRTNGSRSNDISRLDQRPLVLRQRSSSLPSAARTPLSFDQIFRPPVAFPVEADVSNESPQTAGSRDIDELDSRKALVDIKTLTIGQRESTQPPSTNEARIAPVTEGQPLTSNAVASAGPSDEAAENLDNNTPEESNSDEPVASPPVMVNALEPTDLSARRISTAVVTASDQSAEAPPILDTAPANIVEDASLATGTSTTSTEDFNYAGGQKSLLEDATPTQQTGAVETVALMSAAIRGPEDFESFGLVHDFDATDDDMGIPASDPRPETEYEQKPLIHELDARPGRTSNPESTTSAAHEGDPGPTRVPRSRSQSVPRPPSRNRSVHRRSGLMAREPRVQTESTSDFADFIRSTGPNKRQDARPVLLTTSQSVASLREMRRAHAPIGPDGERLGSSGTVITVDGSAPPVPRVPRTPSRPRTTMQPRSPVASSDGHSELIDFIRSGPTMNGQHRISRTVAPFRSTMDSDELQGYSDIINGMRLGDSSSAEKRRSVSLPNVFEAGQFGHGVAHPAHDGTAPRLSGYAVAVDGPTRRQVRNKDPYARYYMDDDDDDYDDTTDLNTERLTALPMSQPKEESLAEFLRNSSPPPDNGRTARGDVAPRTPTERTNIRPATGKQGSPGVARSARVVATRAETDDFIRFLDDGPPTDSAPSPTIGPDRWAHVPKQAMSVRTERSVRGSIRRSALFSWIK